MAGKCLICNEQFSYVVQVFHEDVYVLIKVFLGHFSFADSRNRFAHNTKSLLLVGSPRNSFEILKPVLNGYCVPFTMNPFN